MTTSTEANRTEEYWTARNALVDATLAATPAKSTLDKAHADRSAEEHASVHAYAQRLAALAAFDENNGGAPIL